MANKMTAAVLYGKEDLRLERLPVPVAGPGEMIVRVAAALTCGTDLKVYRRGYHAKMLKPPIPFGHELAGTVEEVGVGVTKFQAGDRVVASVWAGAKVAARHLRQLGVLYRRRFVPRNQDPQRTAATWI